MVNSGMSLRRYLHDRLSFEYSTRSESIPRAGDEGQRGRLPVLRCRSAEEQQAGPIRCRSGNVPQPCSADAFLDGDMSPTMHAAMTVGSRMILITLHPTRWCCPETLADVPRRGSGRPALDAI